MLRFILFSLFVWAIGVHGGAADIIRIPLVYHKSPRQALLEAGVDVHKLVHLTKYQKPKPSASNDSIALFKYLDSEFFGVVSIGRPAQQFTVVFDTAWANAWVPSSQCPSTNLACQVHKRYDSSMSSSYVPNGEKFHADISNNDTLDGFLSTDVVHIAHKTIQNMTFAEVTSVPLCQLTAKADGVFGMAYSSLAVDNVEPFFYTLWKEKLIPKPVFSFYINRDPTSPRGGSLFLGGSDPKHYNGTFTYLPVRTKDYWKISMDRVEIFISAKNMTIPFCVNGCEVIMDTSTSSISGPAEEINQINKVLSATKSDFGRYVVPCNLVPKMPTISFVFSGKKFSLKPPYYIVQMTMRNGTVCASAFTPSGLPSSNTWILGGAFISKYYTEFDLERNLVGFALSNVW